MKNKVLLIFIALLTGFQSFSQRNESTKTSIALNLDLENAASDDLFHVYLKGEEQALRSLVSEIGGTTKARFRSYNSVALTKEQLVLALQSEVVEAVHYEQYKGQPLLDVSKIHTKVDVVHAGGQGLPDSYRGEGVIVGIIDAGLDLNHPDFKDANGNTRVLHYWDQTLSYSSVYTPSYGYGRAYSNTEINSGLCPSVDQAIYYGHGTNTTGIVASNGLAPGGLSGMAPEADIIVVSSNFSSFGWTNTVADAVDYIFAKAEYYGKPCVINASLGTYLGSHDGKDFASELIEADITATSGRAMVCAAGNSGSEEPYHLGYNVTSDTNFTWFQLPSNSTPGNTTMFLELYGDVGSIEQLEFSMSADKVSPYYEFRGANAFFNVASIYGTIGYDTIFSESGNYLSAMQYYADSNNGVYRVQIYLYAIDSVAYNYGLQVTGSGRFDLWSSSWLSGRDMIHDNLPSTSVYPRISKYKLPDINQSIVSSWACSDKVITVGNYVNRTSYTDYDSEVVTIAGVTAGAIAANSSLGPSRQGLQKPEISAPGDYTLTSGAAFQIAAQLANPSQRNRVAPSGYHNRAGGTSSASPVVAGIGALFFEKCPGKNWSDFKEALLDQPIVDQYTGSVPTNQWGYGKVNAFTALNYTTPNPALIANGNQFCEGDSFVVQLATSYDSILWVNGDTADWINVTQSGIVYATVKDGFGCVGNSDSVAVFKRPNPVKPIINSGKTEILACPNDDVVLEVEDLFGAYTWNTGAHTNLIHVTQTGFYHCEVFNVYGCSNVSDDIHVVIYPTSPAAEIVLNAHTVLFNTVDTSIAESYKWFFNFIELNGADSVAYVPTQLGVYQTSYIDSFGCEYKSENITFYAFGLGEASGSEVIAAFPNPTNSVVHFTQPNLISSVNLYDAQGQLIFESDDELTSKSIDFTNYPSGVYWAKLKLAGNEQKIRIVKQ